MPIELIPAAGACLVSKNVLSGAGRVKWMVREESQAAADNGCRIFSDVDTTEYLHDEGNGIQVVVSATGQPVPTDQLYVPGD